MNKELKKAAALLEEKEKARAAIIAKAEKELKETQKVLNDLNTKLANAESAEEYKKLLAEIRDNEAVKAFCVSRLETAKAAALKHDEYLAIRAELTNAFNSIQAEQGAILGAEIAKLQTAFNNYDSQVQELNALLSKAGKLANHASITPFNPQSINYDDIEIKYFIDALYRTKNARAMLKKGLKPV